MTLRNDKTGYGAVAQTLHWASGFFVLVAWLLGTFIDDFPKAAEPSVLFVHMSLGLAVAALLLVRLGWRLADPLQPSAETALGPWSDRLALLMQWILYGLLLAGPVSGVVLEFARGQPVPVFGLFEITSPWTRDRAFAKSVKEVHELLADALMILASLHAAAALLHHYVLKDATLLRMLPRARR
ncbi:MAG: cytochrome b/b6 domain-containing protein [Proteobacteria bacterium]|nr:cytochrome b/b6 domain-containing protein [Pseudomonadota bacterium]